MIDYQKYKLSKREWTINILGIAVLLIMIALLFYDNLLITVFLLPLGWGILKYRQKYYKQQRLWVLNVQFKEAINCLNTALGAGYSIENAIDIAINDLHLLYEENSLIIQEFVYIKYQLSMNQTVEQAFLSFASRTGLEDIQNFADVFASGKRTGGNLIEIINRTSRIISDKHEIQQQIKTLVSAKRLEGKIMSVVPMVFIFYIWISSPGFIESLYHNVFGYIVMSVLLIIYAGSYLLMQKIMNIEI